MNTHQALLSPDYQQTDTPNARVAVKVNSYTALQLIKSVTITEQICSSQVYFRDLGSYRFRTATDTHHNRENIYIKVRSCVNAEASVLLKSLKETPTCDYTRLLNLNVQPNKELINNVFLHFSDRLHLQFNIHTLYELLLKLLPFEHLNNVSFNTSFDLAL